MSRPAETTIICGLERLGLRIARALIQLGEKVIIVADSPQPALLREARKAGARIVEGRSDAVAELQGMQLATARCLVLTDNADLGNLHAALAAREVNPRLRVVMRMFNADLADRATKLLPNSRVLSATYEAAPYFAADALGIAYTEGPLVWGRYLIVHSPSGDDGRAAHRIEHRLHSEPLHRFRPDALASPVEHAVELGEGHFLAPVEPPPLPRRRRSVRLRSFIRAARTFFDFRLGVTLGAIAVLLGVSAVVFRAALHLSWVDALYFTVTTASTTGYGDINLLYAPWWAKLYGVGFMFAAALSLATLFALAADAVIGARILEALGVPRRGMRNHVVIVGLGNTGYRIVQVLLEAGVEVAAAEISERNHFIGLARRQGVPVLVADGRYGDSLLALSAQGARAVVAATDDDLANLEAALTARELNPQARIVARLFDQDLAERAQHQLGINACHSVSALATPAFVAAALGEGMLSTIEHGGRLWLVAELTVEAESNLDGLATRAIEQPGSVHVLAVRESATERWRPAWPEQLLAGHDILVACRREGWDRLRSWARCGA